MRLHFERSGGFAGIPVRTDIDTALLAPADARSVEELVRAAGFFDLPEVSPRSTRARDMFEYTLSVEAEGKRHTIRVGDESIPDALQPLIHHLLAVSRKRGRS